MKSDEQLRAAVRSELAEFAAYRGSMQARQLLAFYDALIDAQMAELVAIKPDRLLYKQGAIRQLQALRAALIDTSDHVSPLA